MRVTSEEMRVTGAQIKYIYFKSDTKLKLISPTSSCLRVS